MRASCMARGTHLKPHTKRAQDMGAGQKGFRRAESYLCRPMVSGRSASGLLSSACGQRLLSGEAPHPALPSLVPGGAHSVPS